MPAVKPSASAPVFFLDTNILVYAYSEQDVGKREIARSLVEDDGARISTQVLSELANLLTRKFALPAREVKERIAGVAAGCEVVVVSPAVVLDALRVMEQYGYGFLINPRRNPAPVMGNRSPSVRQRTVGVGRKGYKCLVDGWPHGRLIQLGLGEYLHETSLSS